MLSFSHQDTLPLGLRPSPGPAISTYGPSNLDLPGHPSTIPTDIPLRPSGTQHRQQLQDLTSPSSSTTQDFLYRRLQVKLTSKLTSFNTSSVRSVRCSVNWTNLTTGTTYQFNLGQLASLDYRTLNWTTVWCYQNRYPTRPTETEPAQFPPLEPDFSQELLTDLA